MADKTIRYEPTGEVRVVDESAVPFFPGWDVLKSNGAVNPHPATPVNNPTAKD